MSKVFDADIDVGGPDLIRLMDKLISGGDTG